ncbi:MAG: GNAT family N-acetyltransferase [Gammaproteobacteria bacterium]|jgi:ribosomal-protein-alanine N-acetyltransferase
MSDKHGNETCEIRLARPRDGDNLARMSRRLIEAGLPWWCWTPKRLGKAIRSPDTVGIIATVDRQLSGFAMMHFGDENAHLNLLAVEPALRRRGIGRELLAWLDDSCLVAGIRRITLEVRANNQPAIRFYENLGYVRGERIPRYYCGEEAALRMTRTIAQGDGA